MMVLPPTKPLATTLRCGSVLAESTRTPSVVTPTSSSGVTSTRLMEPLSLPTPARSVLRLWRRSRTSNLGSVSNKSTPCSPPTVVLLVSPRKELPSPKVPTTAVLVLRTLSVVISRLPTTRLASTLVSRSLEPTLRSCLVNGNTKLVPVRESKWEMTCGCLATFFLVCLSCSVLSSPSTLSPSRETGTVLDATATTPPSLCVRKVESRSSLKPSRNWARSTRNTSKFMVRVTTSA
mmetsp:Transcript_27092/g.42144  ORF Transcript_27092/g.42144 Transcript_27092/m.42144 type:complete len:235 (-) Transcript_27092:303-1007(-)